MDFDTKAFNIILVIFQMKLMFQQTFFPQHSYVCLNKKPHQDVFLLNRMNGTFHMELKWYN